MHACSSMLHCTLCSAHCTATTGQAALRLHTLVQAHDCSSRSAFQTTAPRAQAHMHIACRISAWGVTLSRQLPGCTLCPMKVTARDKASWLPSTCLRRWLLTKLHEPSHPHDILKAPSGRLMMAGRWRVPTRACFRWI